VHEGAERVDVDAVVGLEAAVQLRGDVAGGAEEHAGMGEGLALAAVVDHDLGEAEVEDFNKIGVVLAGDAVAVGGFDIAVDDAVLVGGGEGPGDLLAEVDDALPRERAVPAQGLREVLAVEVLHHEEGAALGGCAEVGDLDDVLVADRRGGAGLLNEALGDRLVGAEARLDDLDGDLLGEREVDADVDSAHAASADAALDAVAFSEDGADEGVAGVLGALRDAGGGLGDLAGLGSREARRVGMRDRCDRRRELVDPGRLALETPSRMCQCPAA
jgi:hypothetical protein